jgi:hypothetical protein
MEWYNYLACFFAGVFIANAVPHLTNGVSGNKFPTPFARPPGKGLSSALTNTLWAIFNFVVGLLLFNAGHISAAVPATWLLFFAGATAISVMLAKNFEKKDKG